MRIKNSQLPFVCSTVSVPLPVSVSILPAFAVPAFFSEIINKITIFTVISNEMS